MPPGTRRIDSLRRTGHVAASLLRATFVRPADGPLKVTLCLTSRCQHRCRTCNIWQRQARDELTLGEVTAFVRANPWITWVDLTGGEIFLHPDVDAILDAVSTGWRRLAILHFPTNGHLTDRIERAARRLAARCAARTIITVSLDGDESTNDEIRGVAGAFRRQIATFRALRAIPGITAVLGVTLSSHNAGRIARIVEACAREVPGTHARDIHLNVAQASSHYYGNDASAGLAASPSALRADLAECRRSRGLPRSGDELLEFLFMKCLERFVVTGRSPMRCHALRASCFIDPSGLVYPCSVYSQPLGSLRDSSMDLRPFWQAERTRRLQAEIWGGTCPQCWTACDAYPSILANVLAARWGRRHPDRVAEAAGERHP
jgi:Fe-coproporphyrin III synthase